jgi:hypothetical protein
MCALEYLLAYRYFYSKGRKDMAQYAPYVFLAAFIAIRVGWRFARPRR